MKDLPHQETTRPWKCPSPHSSDAVFAHRHPPIGRAPDTERDPSTPARSHKWRLTPTERVLRRPDTRATHARGCVTAAGHQLPSTQPVREAPAAKATRVRQPSRNPATQ